MAKHKRHWMQKAFGKHPGKLITVSACRWNFGISSHCDMSETVTVLAKRNEIVDSSIGSDTVDMVNEDYFWMFGVSAIITLALKHLPSSAFIVARSSGKVSVAPKLQLTSSTTVGSITLPLSNFISRNMEWFAALFADMRFSGTMQSNDSIEDSIEPLKIVGALHGAKCLFVSMVFLGYKYLVTLKASIFYRWQSFTPKLLKSEMMSMNVFSAGIFRGLSTTA